MTVALVVVDVQKDFVEGGSLAVAGGQRIADILSSLVLPIWSDHVGPVVFTKDWHIDPGTHFSDEPDYVDSWPPHCIAQEEGADFAADFDPWCSEVTFRKGMYSASYSGADGTNLDGVFLLDYLHDIGATEVNVVGIAFDYCVAATAKDLVSAGFDATVVKSFTASVHPENDANTIKDLEAHGVHVLITDPMSETYA